MRWHLWHDWVTVGDDLRRCTKCDRLQAFSSELASWFDLDYLSGTNYDAGAWPKSLEDTTIEDLREEPKR